MYFWSSCLYIYISKNTTLFIIIINYYAYWATFNIYLYTFPWTVEGNTRPVAHQRLHSPCTQCLCQCFGSDLYHQVPSSWRGQKVEWLAFSGRIHQDGYVFAIYILYTSKTNIYIYTIYKYIIYIYTYTRTFGGFCILGATYAIFVWIFGCYVSISN